jgi:glutaredoxin
MLQRALFAFALGCSALLETGVAGAQSALADIHAPRVVMYATATCPYCAKARAYFTQHGIRWEERDIEASTGAEAEWKAKGGVGTPLILIDDAAINGFDQPKLDGALSKYSKQ